MTENSAKLCALNMAIDIVIPTYNSEAWLDELLKSIVAQDFEDWRIIARDDASKDQTREILESWRLRLGKRFVLLGDSGRSNLGMIGNYNAVLAASSANYVMLADPDDVWLPGKISLTVQAMQAAEQQCEEKPIVVCTDATVVDEKLQPISKSYWQWLNQDADLVAVFHRMVVESPALTSTMMINRELLDVALPLTGASCPDWWLALTACAFGRIVPIQQSTILYRRHSANDSLAPMASTMSQAVSNVGNARTRIEKLIRQFAPQAGNFLHRFGEKLSPADAAALRAAEKLPELGRLERRMAIVSHGLWFASARKNAGLMLFV